MVSSSPPVLAADLEGISDVIREGENGHLVPSEDAAAFEQHVLRYRADRALRDLADLPSP